MVQDYFQDITPPHSEDTPRSVPITQKSTYASTRAHERIDEDTEVEVESIYTGTQSKLSSYPKLLPAKGIRNVPVSLRARDPDRGTGRPSAITSKSIWIFVPVVVALLGLIGGYIYSINQTSTIDVTPRFQVLNFTGSNVITAYPDISAGSSTLRYTIVSKDFATSTVVSLDAVKPQVAGRARGTIVIHNTLSKKPFQFVANTRFITANGSQYRSVVPVVVPPLNGIKPGEVSVTVVADKSGAIYNASAGTRLSIPGLKTNPQSYAKVYATVSDTFTGGTTGGVATNTAGPVNVLRQILESQINIYNKSLNSTTSVVLSNTAHITYTEKFSTATSSGILTETARVSIPILERASFTQAVADAVGIDTQGASVRLVEGAYNGIVGSSSPVLSATSSNPLYIVLTGTTRMIWNIDHMALSKALLGVDTQTPAFTKIIASFPGIQEARPHILPGWSHTFPSSVSRLKVVELEPQGISTR